MSNQIRNNGQKYIYDSLGNYYYNDSLILDKDIYEQWFCGIFTKTICEAKNFNQLMKAKTIAEELGMKEGEDFFLIWDACLTELQPEKYDENGVGRTLTCIGFKPLDDETAWKISKKFQLYK
jgi:PTH2 family peptidyl-tRNA hydrolase